MTKSQVICMIETFRAAWPESTLSDDDAAEIAKLFGAYETEVVTSVIADRLEADLPMPGLAELSRVLRVYAPGAPSDPQPPPEQRRPASPWIHDLEEFPPVPGDISERIAEIRALVERPPEPAPPAPVREPDPEFAWHVDQLRACAEEGRRQFALDRKARLDAAK